MKHSHEHLDPRRHTCRQRLEQLRHSWWCSTGELRSSGWLSYRHWSVDRAVACVARSGPVTVATGTSTGGSRRSSRSGARASCRPVGTVHQGERSVKLQAGTSRPLPLRLLFSKGVLTLSSLAKRCNLPKHWLLDPYGQEESQDPVSQRWGLDIHSNFFGQLLWTEFLVQKQRISTICRSPKTPMLEGTVQGIIILVLLR